MDRFEEIEKRVSFAEFLTGRGESIDYATGAMKHVYGAAELLFQELTGMNSFDSKSPQIVESSLKKFKEPEITTFSKFYLSLMEKADRASISVAEVESEIRKLRKYIDWVRKHKKL